MDQSVRSETNDLGVRDFSMRATSGIGTRWITSTSPRNRAFTRVEFSGMKLKMALLMSGIQPQ